MKIDTDVELYEERDVKPKAGSLAKIFGAGVTDPDKFHRRLYGVDVDRGSGCELFDIKVAVIHKDTGLVFYLSELHCTLMGEDAETLGDMSRYSFYAWDSQAMKVIGKKERVFIDKYI